MGLLFTRVDAVEGELEKPALTAVENELRRDRWRIRGLSAFALIAAAAVLTVAAPPEASRTAPMSWERWWGAASTAWGGTSFNLIEAFAVLLGVALPLFLAVSLQWVRDPRALRLESASVQLMGLEIVSFATCVACAITAWTLVPTTLASGSALLTIVNVGLAHLFATLAALSKLSEGAWAMSLAGARRRRVTLEALLNLWMGASETRSLIEEFGGRPSRQLWGQVFLLGGSLAALGTTAAVVLGNGSLTDGWWLFRVLLLMTFLQSAVLLYLCWRMVRRAVWIRLEGRWRSLIESVGTDVLLAVWYGIWLWLSVARSDGKTFIFVIAFLALPLIAAWWMRRSGLIMVLKIRSAQRELDRARRQEISLEERTREANSAHTDPGGPARLAPEGDVEAEVVQHLPSQPPCHCVCGWLRTRLRRCRSLTRPERSH